jgi:hypothetical protein
MDIDEVPEDATFRGSINLYGYTLSYGMPDWMVADLKQGYANTNKYQGDGFFSLAQMPQGEDFDGDWSVLHSICALKVEDLPHKYWDELLATPVYQSNCQSDYIPIQVSSLSANEVITVEGCGNFVYNGQKSGEIQVAYLTIQPEALIKVAMIWNAPNGFRLGKPSTHPVSTSQMKAKADMLKTSRVITGK